MLDVRPRELTAEQDAALAALARQVMGQPELRAALQRESGLRHSFILDGAVEHAYSHILPADGQSLCMAQEFGGVGVGRQAFRSHALRRRGCGPRARRDP